MIKYFKYVIKKNFYYWDKYHHTAFMELWNKTENLNKIEKVLCRETLVYSITTNENYIGPNRKKEYSFLEISDKYMRNLKAQDYKNMIKELVQIYFSVFYIRHTFSEPLISYSFKFLFNEDFVVEDEKDLTESEKIKTIVDKGLEKNCKSAKKSSDLFLTMFLFLTIR